MPKRNENESERRGSSRSGGKSGSGRGNPKRKPFSKGGYDNTKSEGGSFGKGRASGSSRPDRKTAGDKPFRSSSGGSFKSSSSSRPFRKTDGDKPFRGSSGAKRGESAKPFGKRSEKPFRKESGRSFGKDAGRSFGRDSGRTFGRDSGTGAEDASKSFSQKSRFAKKDYKSAPRTRGGENRGGRGDSAKPNGRPSGAPRDGRSEKKFSKDSRRISKAGDQGRPEPRGASFGKPYKKAYKSRPDRTGAGSIHRKQQVEGDSAPKSDKVRLNKFIANSGISSRREADELITMGLISVNGKIITELGYKVNPGDEVRYESKVLRAEKPVYILMNKPKGFLTTTEDPQDRKTVMHIVGSAVKERIYPVGRLDRNTTGLLLLTNDGDLADRLMHPSFNIKKVYKVELDRPLTKGDLQSISEGVRLEEGRATVDDIAIVSEDGRTVGVELHIGWNRVVRRIFESLGYEVQKLDRTIYAGLDKKELSRGQWRFLTKEEIIHLKHFK